MKLAIILLGFLNGGYMFLDGLFVIFHGKYIGPAKPGPWAGLFQKLQVDVFKLGPVFVCFGIAWLIFLAGLYTNQNWAHTLGLFLSVLTVWYLPVGTIISVIVFVLLLLLKRHTG